MREMVLNHPSALATGHIPSEVVGWLADLALGVGSLVGEGVVKYELRTMKELYEVDCLTDWALSDAMLEMRRMGYREEYLLLARLATRSPLLRGLPATLKDRFHGCEGVAMSPEEGKPLLLCAVADWVAVGLPSAPAWDQDAVVVEFDELLPDATTERRSRSVDNLTRRHHAVAISQRHRQSVVRKAAQTYPSLRLLSYRDILRVLKDFGFEVKSMQGSHAKLERGQDEVLIVPRAPAIGTVRAIYQQASRYIPEERLRPHFFN